MLSISINKIEKSYLEFGEFQRFDLINKILLKKSLDKGKNKLVLKSENIKISGKIIYLYSYNLTAVESLFQILTYMQKPTKGTISIKNSFFYLNIIDGFLLKNKGYEHNYSFFKNFFNLKRVEFDQIIEESDKKFNVKSLNKPLTNLPLDHLQYVLLKLFNTTNIYDSCLIKNFENFSPIIKSVILEGKNKNYIFHIQNGAKKLFNNKFTFSNLIIDNQGNIYFHKNSSKDYLFWELYLRFKKENMITKRDNQNKLNIEDEYEL